MNILEAEKQTEALFESGNAVIWESGSGLGKSTVARRLFEKFRDRDAPLGIRWGWCETFAATNQPTDLIGIQFKGEREYQYADPNTGAPVTKKVTVTDPALPLWMMSDEGIPAFMYDRVFLFIDEYGQGEADTKRAMAQMFLKGGTPPWYLPIGSVRLAATNVGARYGVSKDFDFCIARRFVLPIEGDIKVTLNYLDTPYWHEGKKWTTLGVTKLWAKQHPEIVFEKEPKEQGPWCNPRQLCAVDRYIQSMWKINGNQEIDAEMTQVIAGGIGMPATQSLLGHFKFMVELPQYEDVVKDPAGTPVPTKADLMMLMAYQMAALTQSEHLAQVIEYISKMPKDFGVTYITSLLRRDYKGIVNQPAMQNWINKNASLVAVVSALAQQ